VGPHHPHLQDSALSDSGAEGRGDHPLAGGADAPARGLADDGRDDLGISALRRIRHPGRDADRGSRTVESYVYPLLVFSQSIPKIAIAPLFVVWFGFGMLPKVLSAFLLGFFPVVVSAVQGFKSVEPDMMDLARSMEANRWQIFRMVSLPHAMPSIFAGLKVSITLAVVGAVVGEFVGSNYGIGFVLQRSIGNFELPTMFAALVVLALIGVVLFWILDVIERLAIPWHASQRQDVFLAA
jgi:NitT/TauT family transport system permease protein